MADKPHSLYGAPLVSRDYVFRSQHCSVLLLFVCLSVDGILFWNWQYSLCFFWVWLPVWLNLLCATWHSFCQKKTSCVFSRNQVQISFWDTSEMWYSAPDGITSIVKNGCNQLRWPLCSQNAMQLRRCIEPLTHWGPTKGLVCILAAFPQISGIVQNFDSYCPCLLSAILTHFHGFVVS